MDIDSMPNTYKEAFNQSISNMGKLQDASNIGHHQQADIQNLFNSTQIQQNQIFEDILALLPTLQITGGQEGTANDVLARLTTKWADNLNLSRNVMQIIDISNKKERGELSYDMTIDLINTPRPELTGATSVVPENIVRNIKEFTGTKNESEDLDIILEGFLKSIFEAGQTQKLTHSAQKELIIRKLAPNCILLINSYLDTSNKTISDTTLPQLIGILEQIYMPNSQPSEALVKLQSLGKVKNGDYLSHCAIISRLVRLSVRKEANSDSKRALQESRSAEYMKYSLSEADSHLIRQLEIKRAEEQKQPLTALKIAKYLTQYHHNKNNVQDNFELSTVNKVDQCEAGDSAVALQIADRGNFRAPYRPQFRPRGYQRGYSSPNNVRFGSFRGQRGNFRPNYNQRPNPVFRPRFQNFQRPNNFQKNSFRGQNQYYVNPTNSRGTWGRQNGSRAQYSQGQQRGRGGQNYRPPIRDNNGFNSFNQASPLVISDAKVQKGECIMCGNLHSYKSFDCCYNGMTPTRRTNANIPAPVCPIHKKFLHTAEQCLGDVKINMSKIVELPQGMEDFENDFDEYFSKN